MNFDKLMNTDNNAHFADAVADINTRGTALQLDIQKYLVAVANRWVATGDVRPAVDRVNMLISKKALFKGVRRNAILMWVEAFLGFEYLTEGENKDMFHANKAKAKDRDLQAMTKAENHWYTFTPEPEYKPMNLNAMIAALVAKAEKRVGNAKPEDHIPAEQLAGLKALIAPESAGEAAQVPSEDAGQGQAADDVDAALEAGVADLREVV